MELEVGIYGLRQIYLNKNYAFFDSNKPYNLNIFGVRSMEIVANRFDDIIGVCYRDAQLEWRIEYWQGTTDTGAYWLRNPMNVDGTAILVPDQYRGAWKLGLHRGKYLALIQAQPVRVYRDDNLDEILDYDAQSVQEGLYGINIHRGSERNVSYLVNKWSAGCQVVANPENFHDLITLCERQKSLYGDSFTYTLFEQVDFMEVDPENVTG
jgi:hypothetical protein